MTKKQIAEYKVIPKSEEAKELFNRQLKDLKIYGTFKNEYGELFVIYAYKYVNFSIFNFITGDELGWEMGWEVDSDGCVSKRFFMSEKEREEIRVIEKTIEESK